MAKRIYATIVNAGSNTDGFKEQGKSSSLKSEVPTELLSLQSLIKKGILWVFCSLDVCVLNLLGFFVCFQL